MAIIRSKSVSDWAKMALESKNYMCKKFNKIHNYIKKNIKRKIKKVDNNTCLIVGLKKQK